MRIYDEHDGILDIREILFGHFKNLPKHDLDRFVTKTKTPASTASKKSTKQLRTVVKTSS